jgi:hypothetical protein
MNIKCEIVYTDICTARDHIIINKYGVGVFKFFLLSF